MEKKSALIIIDVQKNLFKKKMKFICFMNKYKIKNAIT